MKNLVKLAIATSAAALLFASPASALTPDSESYVLNLNGTVDSNCELIPEGSGTFNVDMENFGNQGTQVILYSCNSPYKVSLQSQNGGMEHQESGGLINIAYVVETLGFDPNGITATSTNSTAMQASPVDIVTVTSWANILSNGGIRTGNLDLVFPGLSQSSVAGTYTDKLTITLTAVL